MSQAQHTQGPWEILLTHDEIPEYKIFSGDAEITCGIFTKEDALLIAASPTLLAFAEATAQTFGADTMIGAEARAAIAAAKGEA